MAAATVATPVVTQMDICSQRPGRAINKITAAVTDITAADKTATLTFPTALDATPEIISVIHVADNPINSVVTSASSSAIVLTINSVTAVASSVSVVYQTVIG